MINNLITWSLRNRIIVLLFAGAVAVYAGELGGGPLVANPRGYRSYVRGLVESGRAFGIVEDDEVVFKADIGAVGGGVAQVQGVWLRPDQRGRGLAAPAMAAVSAMTRPRSAAARPRSMR